MLNRNIPSRNIKDIPPLDTPRISTQVHHRLSPQAYQQLEAQVGHIRMSDQTSDINAGFQLGIQHVLRYLRDGFVAG